jgi:hypothetical protein
VDDKVVQENALLPMGEDTKKQGYWRLLEKIGR